MKTLARIIRRVLVIALVAVIAMCALTVWRGYGMYREALADRPISQTVEELRATDTYTELDELPQMYLNAVVAVEDHRFYEHGGVDPIAICRAAFNDLRTLSLREGGSTITQQVAKNLFFTQDKHFERKVAEAFMAFDLEARYSKREILELYVNSSYFGSGYTGIGRAAPGYLGCDPSDMSDYECALMAGFPNAPELFAADPQAADSRARVVVQQMEKYGFDPGDAAF